MYKLIPILVLVIIFSGCAASTPKDLAQETFNLNKDIMAAINDPSKIEALGKKMETIKTKVEQLSAADKMAYQVELARLMTSGAGSSVRNLLDSAAGSNLMNLFESGGAGIPDTPELQNLLKSLEAAASSLNQ